MDGRDVRVAGMLYVRRRTRGRRALGRTRRAPRRLRLHRRGAVHRRLVTVLHVRATLGQKRSAVVDDGREPDLGRRMRRVLLDDRRHGVAQHLAFGLAAVLAGARIILGRRSVVILRGQRRALDDGTVVVLGTRLVSENRFRIRALVYGDHVDLLVLFLVDGGLFLDRLLVDDPLARARHPRVRFPLFRHQTPWHGIDSGRDERCEFDDIRTEREPVSHGGSRRDGDGLRSRNNEISERDARVVEPKFLGVWEEIIKRLLFF